MPFEPGNQYGKKAKLVDAVIRKITVQDLESGEGKSQLIRGLRKMLKRAGDGDQDAIDWWTNRESGKPGGDDGDKSQMIQVVINGYADVQARIVDNSQVHDHGGVGVIGGGGEAVGVVASRVPDDSLPTHEVSKLPIHEISELPIPEISELPTEKVAVDTAPSESDPPV